MDSAFLQIPGLVTCREKHLLAASLKRLILHNVDIVVLREQKYAVHLIGLSKNGQSVIRIQIVHIDHPEVVKILDRCLKASHVPDSSRFLLEVRLSLSHSHFLAFNVNGVFEFLRTAKDESELDSGLISSAGLIDSKRPEPEELSIIWNCFRDIASLVDKIGSLVEINLDLNVLSLRVEQESELFSVLSKNVHGFAILVNPVQADVEALVKTVVSFNEIFDLSDLVLIDDIESAHKVDLELERLICVHKLVSNGRLKGFCESEHFKGAELEVTIIILSQLIVLVDDQLIILPHEDSTLDEFSSICCSGLEENTERFTSCCEDIDRIIAALRKLTQIDFNVVIKLIVGLHDTVVVLVNFLFLNLFNLNRLRFLDDKEDRELGEVVAHRNAENHHREIAFLNFAVSVDFVSELPNPLVTV